MSLERIIKFCEDSVRAINRAKDADHYTEGYRDALEDVLDMVKMEESNDTSC